MKLIKKLAHIWVISALVIGWVYFFSKVFTLDFKYQTYVIAFLIAPASEELLYRLNFLIKIFLHILGKAKPRTLYRGTIRSLTFGELLAYLKTSRFLIKNQGYPQ